MSGAIDFRLLKYYNVCMSRYTLKTYSGTKDLETFDNRGSGKLGAILMQPKFHRAGECGPFGEIENNPDTFRIYNQMGDRIFVGNIAETLSFIKQLK